jgi:hypothetical protein
LRKRPHAGTHRLLLQSALRLSRKFRRKHIMQALAKSLHLDKVHSELLVWAIPWATPRLSKSLLCRAAAWLALLRVKYLADPRTVLSILVTSCVTMCLQCVILSYVCYITVWLSHLSNVFESQESPTVPRGPRTAPHLLGAEESLASWALQCVTASSELIIRS